MALFKPFCYIYHGSYNLLPWHCSNPFAIFTMSPTNVTMTLVKPFYYVYHESNKCLPWHESNHFTMFTMSPTNVYHSTVQTLSLCLPWVQQLPFCCATITSQVPLSMTHYKSLWPWHISSPFYYNSPSLVYCNHHTTHTPLHDSFIYTP